METPLPPLAVDVGVGDDWREAKNYYIPGILLVIAYPEWRNRGGSIWLRFVNLPAIAEGSWHGGHGRSSTRGTCGSCTCC